jgi:glutaminase
MTRQEIASPILDYLRGLHAKYADLQEGTVAHYIPALSKADPNWFGISLVTTDGCGYEVGDSRRPFSIQSISKPFVYGIALEDNGLNKVLEKIGVEPTGDAFNAISLDPATGRPSNPMINAGAIAAASLVEGKTSKQKMNRILEAFSRYAGRDLQLDETVYRSESETGHRNRAISHMLRSFNIIPDDPAPSLDAYFRQCSLLVTCTELAVMAATLANGGINPRTNRRAVVADYVSCILSVMGSCGMYDYAGEWVYCVGMPAKSGVSGGILAVLPGHFGIGVYSPRLDAQGNSVRGIKVCQDLSRDMQLHLFRVPRAPTSAVRRTFTAAQVSSKRIRAAEEAEVLREHGSRIVVYQLQGDFGFGSAEAVMRNIVDGYEHTDFTIVDFRHVEAFDESSCVLLAKLVRSLKNQGKYLVFTHLQGKRVLSKMLRKYFSGPNGEAKNGFEMFEDNDLALEWCENRLIESHGRRRRCTNTLTIEEFDLFRNVSQSDLREIEKHLSVRAYKAGDVIVEAGDPPREMFLIASGKASASIQLPDGRHKRLATFSPGMTFGEMGIIDGAFRSGRVLADLDMECYALTVDALAELSRTQPEVKITILTNMLKVLSSRLRKANAEISVLSS